MKQSELNGRKALLVGNDGIFYRPRIGKSGINKGKLFASCDVTYGKSWELPPGEWEVVGVGDLITEEQWRELVESWESVAKDGTIVYQNYEKDIPKCRTATKSGHSFLRKEGFEPKDVFVLIQKI